MATQRDPRTDLSPRKVAERLKEEGKQRVERGKATAAEQVDHVANALRSAGDELGGQSTLGNYANQFASSISRLGTRLRESSIEDLASDMQAAARRNPTMFVLGGLAVGLALSRLVKASVPDDEAGDNDNELSGENLTASPSGDYEDATTSEAELRGSDSVGGDFGTATASTRTMGE